jgi:hypothetical protein
MIPMVSLLLACVSLATLSRPRIAIVAGGLSFGLSLPCDARSVVEKTAGAVAQSRLRIGRLLNSSW